jgi:hypothetical protein
LRNQQRTGREREPVINKRKEIIMITENNESYRCTFQVLVDSQSEISMFEAEKYIYETLASHGIRLSCSPSRNQGRRGLKRYTLIFHVDKETAGRGAGRKEAVARYGMDEAIRQEKAGKEKRVIAEEMGISLATYYRRRKKHMMGSGQQ